MVEPAVNVADHLVRVDLTPRSAAQVSNGRLRHLQAFNSYLSWESHKRLTLRLPRRSKTKWQQHKETALTSTEVLACLRQRGVAQTSSVGIAPHKAAWPQPKASVAPVRLKPQHRARAPTTVVVHRARNMAPWSAG
jgi:hypothetical protein